MMIQIATSLVILGEQHFDHGYLCGRLWYFNGDPPEKPVTWEDVVDFIKGTFLELDREGFLDEERLYDNAGFLIGMPQMSNEGVDHEGYITAGVNFPDCYFEPACPVGV